MTPENPADGPIKEIILRFLEGVASEKEIERLYKWLEEHESNRKYFDEVNNTYQVSVTLNRFNQPTIDEDWKKIANEIKNDKTPHFSERKPTRFVFLKVAATISVVALVGILLFKFFVSSKAQKQETIVKNSKSNNTRIVLPDGSTVWLNANSTIVYNPDFGQSTREVTLKGEAFFDVKKDNKSFIVRTDNMQVHVKGTRFNVEAYKKNGTIKTTLEEGKVELHGAGSDKFFTMKPGDQIILNTQLNNVVVKKVNPFDVSAWKEDRLVFDNTPLSEVVAKLESRYKVSIVISSAKAKQDRLTMTVEQEDIEEVLELIKLSSQLQVKKAGNEILLYE
jgi:transmembrane sensor